MLMRRGGDLRGGRGNANNQSSEMIAGVARKPNAGDQRSQQSNCKRDQGNVNHRRDHFIRLLLELFFDLLFTIEELRREPIEIPE